MISHGKLPASLEAMKLGDEKNQPVLKQETATIDPWGNAYLIETSSIGMVVVYSKGPPGGAPIGK